MHNLGLTCDKDFGEWVFSHQKSNISVILLRYQFSDLEKINLILKKLILEKGQNLFGKFTTITKEKVRITNLR